MVNSISVGTGNSRGQISISGTGNARYHVYNGGEVVEWLFGQDSSTSHDFTFSTLVSTTATKRATITQNGYLIATPRYGVRYKASNQTIAPGPPVSLTWTDDVYGVLTSDGVSLTNSTGGTLVVMFQYTILWDPALGGGAVSASLVQSGPSYRQTSYASVFPTTYNATNSGSVVIEMENDTSVYMIVDNELGGNLDVKGGAFSSSIVSRMSYYVMN